MNKLVKDSVVAIIVFVPITVIFVGIQQLWGLYDYAMVIPFVLINSFYIGNNKLFAGASKNNKKSSKVANNGSSTKTSSTELSN